VTKGDTTHTSLEKSTKDIQFLYSVFRHGNELTLRKTTDWKKINIKVQL
jgi:hypothetical protein